MLLQLLQCVLRQFKTMQRLISRRHMGTNWTRLRCAAAVDYHVAGRSRTIRHGWVAGLACGRADFGLGDVVRPGWFIGGQKKSKGLLRCTYKGQSEIACPASTCARDAVTVRMIFAGCSGQQGHEQRRHLGCIAAKRLSGAKSPCPSCPPRRPSPTLIAIGSASARP